MTNAKPKHPKKGQQVEAMIGPAGLIEALINCLNQPLIVSDLEQRLLLANSAAESLFGFQVKKVQGRKLDQVIQNGSLNEFVTQSLVEGTDAERELELVDPETGQKRTLSARSTLLRDGNRKPLAHSVLLRDITALRKLESRLKEFRSTLRHEMLTPLASLKGFAELMLSRQFPEEKKREFLQIIHDESLRLTKLVDGLFNETP